MLDLPDERAAAAANQLAVHASFRSGMVRTNGLVQPEA